MVQATSVNNFKNLLDAYLEEVHGVSMSDSLLIHGPHSFGVRLEVHRGTYSVKLSP